MSATHSKLEDDKLNKLVEQFNSDLKLYPDYLKLNKTIKSAIDTYNVTVFLSSDYEYRIYLFDLKGCLLNCWYGCDNSIIECVKQAVENYEGIYYTPRSEFIRWDGNLE